MIHQLNKIKDRFSRPSLGILFSLFVLCSASLFITQTAVQVAEKYTKKGRGFDSDYRRNFKTHANAMGIFRFDSRSYRTIAAQGYHYTGNKCQIQNIVFMPVYPLFVRYFSRLTGIDITFSGLLISRLFFLLGCIFLFIVITNYFGPTAAVFTLWGINFSAGSYAFQAYYSESTFLLFFSLTFYFLQKKNYLLVALCSAFLSGTRLTAIPFSGLLSLYFAWLAIRAVFPSTTDPPPRRFQLFLKFAALALGCNLGLLAYLGYIALNYDNPFELLPAIQTCAWGKLRIKMSLVDFFTFRHLWDYVPLLWEKPTHLLLDIQKLNILWTLASFVAAIYILTKPHFIFKMGFVLYFAEVYYAGAASPLLTSTHRYFVLMLPIFILLADLFCWIKKSWGPHVAYTLALLGAIFGFCQFFINLILFTAGTWYYF